MNVLHLSAADAGGGAFRAAYLLHAGLREAGCNSTMLVERKLTADEHVLQLQKSSSAQAILARKIRSLFIKRDLSAIRSDNSEIFSQDRSRFGSLLSRSMPDCDIVHLHWVASYVDYSSFFRLLPSNIKICWTLHDMNPLTGGCHYSFGCTRFQGSCGHCPQLITDSDNDISRKIWNRKSAALNYVKQEQMAVVCPSKWIYDQSSSSSLLSRFPHHVIPYGMPLASLKPMDRQLARKKFGIPAHTKHVITFVSQDLGNPRKGFHLLKEVLLSLPNKEELAVLCVGGGRMDLPEIECFSHWLSDYDAIAAAYSVADVTVVPSLEDNLPLTVLESLACGTPVVAFQIGGITDMIEHEFNGYLAAEKSASALAIALQLALQSSNKEKVRENCRATAVNRYSSERQAREYLELYKKLL